MNEVGVPQSILTYDNGNWKEFVFNDLSGSATKVSSASPTVYPICAAGEGVIIQQITNDPAIRVAVDNRSHKSGGVAHKFYRGPRYVTMEALIIGNTPSGVSSISQQLTGILQRIMQNDGQYLFKPSYAGGDVRFLTVRHYEAIKIQHSTSTTGASQGVSAPKAALVTLVAADWNAYTYSPSGSHAVDIAASGTATVANNGDSDSYPIIRIHASVSGDVTITNNTTGYSLKLLGVVLTGGDYTDIDMLAEVGTNSVGFGDPLSSLDLTTSDFFPITPGGNSITATGAAITVYANDAWA